jgi:hypothetical protein
LINTENTVYGGELIKTQPNLRRLPGPETKKEGSLGVLSQRTHNEALLLKYMHKFLNREDLPWVNLIWEKYYRNGRLPGAATVGSPWWRDILRLIDKYKDFASVNIQDGKSCLFWEDLWNGLVPKLSFPELFSFTRKPKITLAEVKAAPNLHDLFHLPLSVEAFSQLKQLQDILHSVQISELSDVWAYSWGSSNFSSRKAYKQLSGHCTIHPAFRWL